MNKEFHIPELELRSEAKKVGIVNFDVGAGIIRNSSLLLVRRVPNDFLGGFYELPGGGVELDETFGDAVRREVYEEIGLKVMTIIGMTDGFDYLNSSKAKVRQYNFLVGVEDGDIKLEPKEHDNLVWLNKNTINSIHLTPEMRKIVDCYFEQINSMDNTNVSM